jgi:CelD/BcsL family acetyltransferase involved in cellulose biosynthesis
VHGTIESAFRVEWRPLADLDAIVPEWQALASDAIEPNVFYEPGFARAAAPGLGRDVGVGLVWARTNPARLLGFFPARIERWRYGLPLPVLTAWTHPFGPLGTPLVARGWSEPVIAAWLAYVADDPRLPKIMLLPLVPVSGDLSDALSRIVDRRGGSSQDFDSHARALLEPGSGRADYLQRAVGGKRRKELRRQRNRLADLGVVMLATTSETAAVLRAVDDFLALEASGWTGRAGTAAHTDDSLRKFLQSAVTSLAGDRKARVARLFLDHRAIAAIIVLRSGATAWCWKIAYDENFARFSPGVQLLLDVTQELLDDPSIGHADSCADQDHPMIDHVWRERLVLADRMIRLGPEGGATFRLVCTLEAARRAAIRVAKSLRQLMRR